MKSLLVFASLWTWLFSFSQPPQQAHYKIYDTKAKELTSIEKIAGDCAAANILFFGEEHNDSTGHWLEAEIFKVLHQRYGDNLALSMEMFETDCQLVVNEYLSGFISEDRFTKEARAWTNYKDYKPLVEFAKQNKLALIAANPPRRYVNMVSRKGMKSLDSLPRASKKFLPDLPYDTATGRYREKFMGFMRGGSPGTGNPRILYSQSLWDAGMSNSIYQFWKKNKRKKIFHLAGRFHCDEKLGIITQLQNRKPGLRILNISCFSDSTFLNPNWEKFSHLGDYVIITDPGLKRSY